VNTLPLEVDVLEEAACSTFFAMKEAFFYYRLFGNVRRKRNFAPTFLAIVSRFLSLDRSVRASLFERFVVGLPSVQSLSRAAASIRGNWNAFDAHLGMEATRSLEALKARYRIAALKLHPDRGGDVEQMKSLNAAFSQLHDLLTRNVAEGLTGDDDDNEVGLDTGNVGEFLRWPGSIVVCLQSESDFDLLLRTDLLIAASDILAEDLYLNEALGLEIDSILAWKPFDLHSLSPSLDIAQAVEDVTELTLDLRDAAMDARQDAIALALGQMSAGWIRSLHSSWEAVAREQSKVGHSAAEKLSERKRLQALTKRLKMSSRSPPRRLHLNQLAQVENALRRGLIDKTRYRTAVRRLQEREAVIESAAALLASFIAHGAGFMRLPLDPKMVDEPLTAVLVPESDASSVFSKWCLRSEHACREYGQAFYRTPTLDLTMKHVRPRIWILLCSVVRSRGVGWETERLMRAADEVELLGALAVAAKEGEASKHARELHDFLFFLAAEGDEIKCARLACLDDLGTEDFRDVDERLGRMPAELFPPMAMAKRQLEEGDVRGKGGGERRATKRCRNAGFEIVPLFGEPSPLSFIVASAEYYRNAKLPLAKLRKHRAGAPLVDIEQKKSDAGVTYFWKHMRMLSEKLQQASWIVEPERRISELGPLIRQAVDRRVPAEAAGEWQLGSYVGALTGAMIRLRRFSEAERSLNEFFTLPAHYRVGLASGEEKILLARLARCQAEQAKCPRQ
jgi:hypothetical protein